MGKERVPTRLGTLVLDRMAAAGMRRQVDLSRRCAQLGHKVSEPTVSRVLYHDDYVPDPATIRGLAAALDLDLRSLILFVYELDGDVAVATAPTLGTEVDRMLAVGSPLAKRDREILATIVDRVIDPYRALMRRSA